MDLVLQSGHWWLGGWRREELSVTRRHEKGMKGDQGKRLSSVQTIISFRLLRGSRVTVD